MMMAIPTEGPALQMGEQLQRGIWGHHAGFPHEFQAGARRALCVKFHAKMHFGKEIRFLVSRL